MQVHLLPSRNWTFVGGGCTSLHRWRNGPFPHLALGSLFFSTPLAWASSEFLFPNALFPLSFPLPSATTPEWLLQKVWEDDDSDVGIVIILEEAHPFLFHNVFPKNAIFTRICQDKLHDNENIISLFFSRHFYVSENASS